MSGYNYQTTQRRAPHSSNLQEPNHITRSNYG